jgi:hypothetical protein
MIGISNCSFRGCTAGAFSGAISASDVTDTRFDSREFESCEGGRAVLMSRSCGTVLRSSFVSNLCRIPPAGSAVKGSPQRGGEESVSGQKSVALLGSAMPMDLFQRWRAGYGLLSTSRLSSGRI